MALTPRDVLAEDRKNALDLASSLGVERMQRVLRAAALDLEERLAKAHTLRGADANTFSMMQMRAALAQVRAATMLVTRGMTDTVLDTGQQAAEAGAANTLQYLQHADEAFRGVAPPMQLEEAGIVDQAVSGVRASILRRLASSGEPVVGADAEAHPAKQGVLERYGVETVGHFERVLQKAFLTRKPWAEVRDELTSKSPFLQAAPKFWAERIVRTETMAAHNRAGYEATRAADDELGDMVKILSAVFDDRTACLAATTRVSGAMVRAVFRRSYDGDALRLVTESGRDLTATPNHPVLTRRGWVQAGELRLGDELVCHGGKKNAGSPGDEHVAGRPPTIGEVFDTLAVSGAEFGRKRSSHHDFHGDGADGEVDVLRSHRELRFGDFAPISKPRAKEIFTPSNNAHYCRICGGLLGAGASVRFIRRVACSQGDPRIVQATCDECLRTANAASDLLDRLPLLVRTRNIFDRQPVAIPGMILHDRTSELAGLRCRSRLPAFREFLGHVPTVDVERARHFHEGHTAAIEFDRLVHIESTAIAGHVFDLSTADGYFLAEGVYVGNSDSYAVHGQIRRPTEPFQSWYGLYQHPPNRPNDREIVVPHRIAWPLPPNLAWRTDGQVAERWKHEGRKGHPPARPVMTTVPLAEFGKSAAKASTPKPAAAKPPVFEVGTHVREFSQPKMRRDDVDVSTVFDEAIPHAGVLEHLAKNPIDELVATTEIKHRGSRPNGTYTTIRKIAAGHTTRTTKIDLRAKRDVSNAKPYEAGKTWSISSLATTPREAVKRTLSHELGHHVHLSNRVEVNAIVKSAFQKMRAQPGESLTQYGRGEKDEYFAESFAAHMHVPELLEKHDPVGHQMVQDVFAKLGIGKR